MRFVVASAFEHRVSSATRLLSALPNVEFRQGSLPEAGEGCSAAVVHYTIAHDRYGGKPVVGRPQILRNHTNDGAPPLILATPPLPTSAASGNASDLDVEQWAIRMISMPLEVWIKTPGYDLNSPSVEVHIEGAGLDFGDFGVVCRGLYKIIDRYR